MNTINIAPEYRLAHWAEIIRQRRESGLSISAFCQREGFQENAYYYWQKKLRENTCEKMLTIETAPKRDKLTPTAFIEVRPVQEKLPLTGNITPASLHIECKGLRITADNTYPAEQLAIVLRGLAAL